MENLSPDTAKSNTTSGNMQIHNLTAAYLDTIHHVNLNLCKTPTQTTRSENFAPAVFKPDPDGLQPSRGGTQAAGYEGHFGREEGARAPPLYDTGVSFAVVWASSAGTKTRLAVAARLLGRGRGGGLECWSRWDDRAAVTSLTHGTGGGERRGGERGLEYLPVT